MAVEALGRRENPRTHDGPGHRNLLRGGEEAEEETAARLSVGKSALSQLVVLSILSLRAAVVRQRDWANVPDEPVLRRGVPDVRNRRGDVHGVRPGGAHRPHDLHLPAHDKCTFYKYGVSGEVERHDAVCILPLNVVNEKIYIFLWFWFLILGVLTLGVVLYRIVIILSPRMRVYLLRIRFRLIRRDAIDAIVRRSKMGDWFLFYMLGENIDAIIFRDVMHELAARLGHHKTDMQDA
ncbi:innexin shaking-B [Nilaparvata lugens]|uniref:innexin shaking-B n=1 Tax=Nilaparvata lugens TaxID=108931 RepID=UPI00193CF83E|nr:innexin shaking-B [Nilaparvata lugens]